MPIEREQHYQCAALSSLEFQTNMVIDLKFTTSCSPSHQTLTHVVISWCLKSNLQLNSLRLLPAGVSGSSPNTGWYSRRSVTVSNLRIIIITYICKGTHVFSKLYVWYASRYIQGKLVFQGGFPFALYPPASKSPCPPESRINQKGIISK